MGMNGNVFGRLDAKPNAVSPNFENGDLDIVGEDDLLVLLPTDD
jgi:hypothetical protein